MPPRDPDEMLTVVFKHLAMQNTDKTLKEGRPIFDDVEVCEIRSPGSREVKHFPANVFARWELDYHTGEQKKVSYAERFSRQYQQFKANAGQTKSGTPLEALTTLTDGRRAELRAQNIYTVEQLSELEGTELKNVGHGGREMKNQAMAYIESSKSGAPNIQLQAELEALRAKNTVLEDDLNTLKTYRAKQEAEFDGMTLEALRDYITTKTGHPPMGSLNRKALTRLALEIVSDKVD